MNKNTLNTEYFSLPEPPGVELTDKLGYGTFQDLKFQYGCFECDLKFEVFFYGGDAVRAANGNFLDFYQNYYSEIKKRNYPVQETTVDSHVAYYVDFPSDDQPEETVLLAAMELSQYSYLVLRAFWQKTDKATLSEQQAVKDFILQIFKSVKIKQDVIDKEVQIGEEEQDAYEKEDKERRERHLKCYTTAEEQAKDPFHARYYPEQFAKLEQALAEYPDLPAHTLQGIYTNARLSIGFTLEEDDYSEKGNTRFYGLPDLPPGVEYPRYEDKGYENCLYKFVAQINFTELTDLQDYLPRKGILYFFIDSQLNAHGGKNNYRHKVFYYDGAIEDLQSANDLDIDTEQIYDVAQGYEIEGGALPAKGTPIAYPSLLRNDTEWDDYPEEYPLIIYDAPKNMLTTINYKLAAAYGKQGGSHDGYDNVINETFLSYISSSEHPCMQAAQWFGGEPQDYIILLASAGNSEINEFMYEDGDSMYFVIHKEKLKNLDFSQVYACNTWWWNNCRD